MTRDTDERGKLADRFTQWVENYASKICPPGCLPLPAQEREISLFAEIAVALRAPAGHAEREALEECASRCRYDGDLFHDQGNIVRRDASWRAADMATAALSNAPADTEDQGPDTLGERP